MKAVLWVVSYNRDGKERLRSFTDARLAVIDMAKEVGIAPEAAKGINAEFWEAFEICYLEGGWDGLSLHRLDPDSAKTEKVQETDLRFSRAELAEVASDFLAWFPAPAAIDGPSDEKKLRAEILRRIRLAALALGDRSGDFIRDLQADIEALPGASVSFLAQDLDQFRRDGWPELCGFESDAAAQAALVAASLRFEAPYSTDDALSAALRDMQSAGEEVPA